MSISNCGFISGESKRYVRIYGTHLICKNIQEIVHIYYDSYEFNIFQAIKKKNNVEMLFSDAKSVEFYRRVVGKLKHCTRHLRTRCKIFKIDPP